MITIQTTCQQCGCDFTPTATDIRRGAWRICPPCRDGPECECMRSHATPLQTLRNDPAASTIAHNHEME